jgi:hypothetical protein
LNAGNRHLSRTGISSKSNSGGSLRLMKWLVLIALLVLLLLALFLPDRGLAIRDFSLTKGDSDTWPTGVSLNSL